MFILCCLSLKTWVLFWQRVELLVDFPGGLVVKNLLASIGDAGDMGSIPGSGRSPWKRKQQPTTVFLPVKSHGQRSLAEYSP